MKTLSTILITGMFFLSATFTASARQDNNSVQGNFKNPSRLSIVYVNPMLRGSGVEQMILTSDGGSLMSSRLDTVRCLITKLSSNGVIEWERSIGTDSMVWIRNLVEIPGVGYEVIGYVYLGPNPLYPKCRYLVRLAYDGTITGSWPARTGAKNLCSRAINPILRCADGSYVTVCNYITTLYSMTPYFWRYDAAGNLIDEVIYDSLRWGAFYVKSLFQTTDGGFGVLLVGTGRPELNGKMQLWRLDVAGKKLWSKELDTWPNQAYAEHSSAIQTMGNETEIGGFAVVSINNIMDNDTSHIILQKFDGNGNLLIRKRYSLMLWNAPTQITETPMGNLLIGGFLQNNNSFNITPKSSDFFVLKTTASGDLLWKDSFGDAESGESVMALSAVNDHQFIVSGFTGVNNNSYPTTARDIVYKLSDHAADVYEQSLHGVVLSPNPASESFTISIPPSHSLRASGSVDVTVRDVFGQVMYSGTGGVVSTSGWTAGVYFVEVSGADGRRGIAKVVVGR